MQGPSKAPTKMNTTVYVSNIPFTILESDIKDLFSCYGYVLEIKMIRDRNSGQLRGFCFVTMEHADEMAAAISELNGKEFKGRALKVSEARVAVGTQ